MKMLGDTIPAMYEINPMNRPPITLATRPSAVTPPLVPCTWRHSFSATEYWLSQADLIGPSSACMCLKVSSLKAMITQARQECCSACFGPPRPSACPWHARRTASIPSCRVAMATQGFFNADGAAGPGKISKLIMRLTTLPSCRHHKYGNQSGAARDRWQRVRFSP